MKTFRSSNPESSAKLEIFPSTIAGNVGIATRKGAFRQIISIGPPDVEAVALEILEAVDHGDRGTLLGQHAAAMATNHTLDAIGSLRQAIQAADTDKAETEDRAKLEAEGESLYNVYRATCSVDFKVWAELNDQVRISWVAVAKAAREANK